MNLRTANFVSFLVGVVVTLSGYFVSNESWATIVMSIGASIIASSAVVYIDSFYEVKFRAIRDIMEKWKLAAIYKTRGAMNADCDTAQAEAKKEIDVIGFGLSSWRDSSTDEIKELLKKGVKIRIMTPNPESPFVLQRARDEGQADDSIRHSINKLIEWGAELRDAGGNIEIRTYDWLPMDFYFRIDGVLFIGPYLYSKGSQQTVTFKFEKDGVMYAEYTAYFERVWNAAEPKDNT